MIHAANTTAASANGKDVLDMHHVRGPVPCVAFESVAVDTTPARGPGAMVTAEGA